MERKEQIQVVFAIRLGHLYSRSGLLVKQKTKMGNGDWSLYHLIMKMEGLAVFFFFVGGGGVGLGFWGEFLVFFGVNLAILFFRFFSSSTPQPFTFGSG